MSAPVVGTTEQTEYLGIHLDSIRVDSVLEFDLYLRVNGAMVLYRSADMPFTDRTHQKLMANNVEQLFILTKNRPLYQRYIEKNLDKVLADPEIEETKKAAILYDTSTELVKDVLSNPTYGDNIQRSKDMVANTISFILKGQEAFHSLVRITSFDYYTYTHSVNVCTFSIALAQQLGLDDEEFLHHLGTGALLHDVGKSKISTSILNKKSSLTPQEFEIVKKHPKWGVDLLSESDDLDPVALYPVLQHHERGDRGGYPDALKLTEMHQASKIVAICDTFDAMTTRRVYQKANDTFSTLKTMFALKGAYDEHYLQSLVQLMGPAGLKNS
ncbi:MAG: HD-GYP domain-containing protein [bacterium]